MCCFPPPRADSPNRPPNRLPARQAPTFTRESLYVAGYIGVVPMLHEALSSLAAFADRPGAATAATGVTCGLLATVITQPADTIKTRMQAFHDPARYPQYRSMLSTARHVVAEEGAATLFSGLAPRAARIVGAVFILTGVRDAGIRHWEALKAAAARA